MIIQVYLSLLWSSEDLETIFVVVWCNFHHNKTSLPLTVMISRRSWNNFCCCAIFIMMIQVVLSLLWSTEDLEPTFFCGAIFTKIIQVVLSLLWSAKRLGNYFCCCTIFIMMIQVVLSLLWSAKRISQTIWLYVPISKNCVTFWERKMKRMAEIL